jgi:hypothetical protein
VDNVRPKIIPKTPWQHQTTVVILLWLLEVLQQNRWYSGDLERHKKDTVIIVKKLVFYSKEKGWDVGVVLSGGNTTVEAICRLYGEK